jgi:hypothetical protein
MARAVAFASTGLRRKRNAPIAIALIPAWLKDSRTRTAATIRTTPTLVAAIE